VQLEPITLMKRKKGPIYLGKSARDFERACLEAVTREAQGDIARAKKAYVRAEMHGDIAHQQIRSAAGSLLGDVEEASRRMLHACMGTAVIDLPWSFDETAFSAAVHATLPMRSVARLRSLYIMKAGVWRGDLQSVKATYEMLFEYQRCAALARDLAWKALEAELWMHSEFGGLKERVRVCMEE
jgi:hypothetical protein